ncbi:hypothetical protein [Klebsiella aerogenes]|jgi:type VI secretion system protein ImpB|uniref:hypothetical protein n=2 Tax=Klebsiella TaxID=570 RepID=UPI0005732F00|nr:hypothetical protein [Klebsiella aerogenes]AKK79897.1 hypothetical protein ABY61_01000 [Klebsiella aerogenes]ATM91887.1 hypothetical protein CRN78_15650 [Klebsiella aerogenes]ATX88375.1 hypothetical protein AM345_16345 [Klebsiella aerogenes]ATY02060.1 hypothetical protein AM334_15265 [Klebsiella aerogenes]AVE36874.1 hypothetical protein C4J64_00565 [Klebsiella aerogenes]
MNDAFPGERLSARIHSQLALHNEIEQRVVELLLKSLSVSRFSNIKTHPLIIQEKININNNNSTFLFRNTVRQSFSVVKLNIGLMNTLLKKQE